MMETPSNAIALLGGVRVVADHISRPYTTVASWAARQSIPSGVWPKLVDFAREKGVEGFTYEALAKAHAEPIRDSQDSQPGEAA